MVKDTTPYITIPRLYITSNNKTQGQQFDTAAHVRYTEQLSARYFELYMIRPNST